MIRLFMFFSLLPLIAISQDTDCSYKVIDSVIFSKDQLYLKAREWAARSFVKANEVIQMDDKEAGKIICKGYFEIEGAKNGFGMTLGMDYVSFTLSIDIRDNKYRLLLEDLSHKGGTYQYSVTGGSLCNDKPACGTFWMPASRWAKYKKRSSAESKLLIASFKKAMEKTETF